LYHHDHGDDLIFADLILERKYEPEYYPVRVSFIDDRQTSFLAAAADNSARRV